MELVIYWALILIVSLFGVGVFLYFIILKGIIFYRLKKYSNQLWLDLGSPKLFSLYENVHIINDINRSRELIDGIERSDPINIKLIAVAITMDAFSAKMVPLVLVGPIVFYIMRWYLGK